MKYLLFILIATCSCLVFLSCRETTPNPSKANQDVVEDVEDIMQEAEDDIKKAIKVDTTKPKDTIIWRKDSIN